MQDIFRQQKDVLNHEANAGMTCIFGGPLSQSKGRTGSKRQFDSPGRTLVSVCDRLRRETLAWTMRFELCRSIYRDRAKRISALFFTVICIALVTSLTIPLISLWLGAAFFGVAHVVSGLRHVGIQRSVSPLTWIFTVIAVVMGALQIALNASWPLRVFAVLFGLSIVTEAWRAKANVGKALGITLAILPLVIVGAQFPVQLVLATSHLHGIATLAFVGLIAREQGVSLKAPLVIALVLSIAMLVGWFDAWMTGSLIAPRSLVVSLVQEGSSASWANSDPLLFRRALAIYAFGQALHFATWIKLVPEVDRPTPVPTSFRRSLHAFRHDWGRLAIPLLVLVIVSIPLLLFGGGTARNTYFALTYFHVGLEGAALARRWVVG